MGFSVLGAFIPYYGFCIVMGIVCAVLLGFAICKKLRLNTDDFTIVCAYLLAFGFAGAKILYIAVSLKSIDFGYVFKSMKNFNYFMSAGFVFYGGVIGGALALLLVEKIHKIEVHAYIQCIVPALCVAHAFGRVGCSLVGCCHGKPTKSDFYFLYTESPIAPNNVKLVPVQGIEAFFVFLIAVVCVVLILKKSRVRLEFLYVLSYSPLRFVLEFFRGDSERGFLLSLSTSQIISVSAFAVTVFIIIAHARKLLANKKIDLERDLERTFCQICS